MLLLDVAWKWPPLLVTSLHGVTLWTKNALVTSLVCFRMVFEAVERQSISFMKISFFMKVEMKLRFHKLENFLFVFISFHV